jgi:peptide/nickel transport system ATP-binding protein
LQIPDQIEDLQREFNSSVVLITHDLGVVAELADDVLVMYAGRAMEYGSAEQLFNRPAHPYTWGLLGSMPRFDRTRSERLLAITGSPPSLINVPSGCPFHPRCAYSARNGGLSEEIRPELVPVEPGHIVACHLSQTDREQIWEHEIAPKL